MQQLSTLNSTLTSNISLLQTSLSQADSSIANAKQRSAAGDVPKIDNMLIPTNTVSKQLYDVVTEERGIESAILALQDAFVGGRVTAEVWGKRTRELGREAFRRRWLQRKVGVGMGLDVEVER